MPKIHFHGGPPVSHEDIERNRRLSAGWPRVEMGQEVHGRRLAVVGGGPSILRELETLKSWDGGIWAINGACRWLRDRGVFSIFFAVDPHPIVAQWAEGATDALICSRSDPLVFSRLPLARVTVFDIRNDDPSGILCGSSTATAAVHLAVEHGYRDVTFFGCEGSYQSESHAYMDEKREDRLLVECGGERYLTAPDFFVQCQELAPLLKLKNCGMKFAERSGGLLRAMAENDDFDVIAASRSVHEKLKPKEAA
jgi:hypothetical protein